MNFLIKSILLLSVFAFSQSANAMKPNLASIQAPFVITFLDANQIGPGTAKVDWLSSMDAPFSVEVVDLGTNQVVFFTISFNNSEIIPNLANGDYAVTVTDGDNVPETVKFTIN